MKARPRGILVVGTDTGVGKTHVAAAIARVWIKAGHRVGVIKPVSTGGVERDGALRSDDADALIAAITTDGSPFPPPPYDRVAPLIYPNSLAPPVAARVAGFSLQPSNVVEAIKSAVEWWTTEARADLLVIEGVGGLLCPLAEQRWTVADLAVQLDYPLLVVAHRGLGTLNHTLMTLEIARARGLRVAGVILNGARPTTDPLAETTNAAELVARLNPRTPILAEWPHQTGAEPDPAQIAEAKNWIDLAATPRFNLDQTTNTHRSDSSSGTHDLTQPSQSEIEIEIPALGRSVLDSSSSGVFAGGSVEPPAASAFPDLNLNLDFAARPLAATPDPATETKPDNEPVEPTRWRSILLASYASALTLALGWTLYQNRLVRKTSPLIAPPTATTAEVVGEGGRLGILSRRVDLAEAIPDDHRLSLGESKQFAALLVEPVAIERRDLFLERVNLTGKTEQRDGGERAVVLRVRLQNQSEDQVFAPIDPAFVRNRADEVAETFLALQDGRKVYPGTLALDSEWTLIGQSLAVLRPGESREVLFATEANAPSGVERLPGTWRIKLRTGIDSTTLIGVKFPGG